MATVPPINVPPPNAETPQANVEANGKACVLESPGASPSPNGVRQFRDGALSRKAASLVGKGLPWPEANASGHDTKNMVRTDGVPWQEKEVTDDYELVRPLGTGGFAKVYVGKSLSTGEDVAIKRIEMLNDTDREVVYKEIKHLTMLREVKHVVYIYAVYELENVVHIVMEMCKGGELHNGFDTLDTERTAYTYGDIGRIAVCMLQLADTMHSLGIVHCDLKPENFCLSEPLSTGKTVDDLLRLIDFGLSQRVRGGQAIAGQAGSIPYMAPEISTRMYDYKVDIWSIGVILYTLLQGRLPFDGRTAQEIMNRAATQPPDMAGVHDAVADFLKWLLTKDPKKRPEAAQALTHPWLKVSSKSGDGYDPYLQAISDEVASNLAKFAASNKLQRAFMHLAVSFLHKNEMQKMLSMFNRLNTDHHTPLPASQMTALLAKGRSAEEAEQFRKTVEVIMGTDGELSIEDFIVATMNQYRNLSDPVVAAMFRLMDTDNDGWVSAEDAYEALHPTGIHITVEELERLFDKYAVKRRIGQNAKECGCMTYHEFHQLMMPSVSQRLTNDLDTVVSAFHNNRELPPFQKLARRIIAENAPPNRELELINKAFHKLDKDGSGTLTRQEMAKGVQQAGYVVSKDDLERVFRELDTDGTGVVRYLEFVAGAISHNILVSDGLLRWVFDFVDDDDSNTVTEENLKTIVNMTDWSDGEKDKIWQAACDESGKYQELTFEQFKSLIIGEGGFHLKAKVEGMAATAQAAQNENANEGLGQELVGLTHAIPSNVSLPQLTPGVGSNPLMQPSDSEDWESAANSTAAAAGLAAMGQGEGSLQQPERSASAGVQSLPVLQEHAHTMPQQTQPSEFDVDPPSDSQPRFDRVRSSNSGRMGAGAWYGNYSDSDDDYDEEGNIQPKLLTKRRTGGPNGGASPDLVRSASEGGSLKSPRAQAPQRRTPYGLASNMPIVTPNELPSRSRQSPTAAGNRPLSANNSVHFREGRIGASPDTVAEHGFTCPVGNEITGPAHTSAPSLSQTEPLNTRSPDEWVQEQLWKQKSSVPEEKKGLRSKFKKMLRFGKKER